MTNKNKNLLLVDYQLDNLQNINQIKLDNTDINVIIDFDNIEITNDYDSIGLLALNSSSINILSLKNKLKLDNINFIDENNYKLYLNIDFNYENDNFVFYYGDIVELNLKDFSIFGGIFYLNYDNNDFKCFINNENGKINFDLNPVGIYSFGINYNIFNLNLNKKIKITILPKVTYNDNNILTVYNNTTFISQLPTIYPNGLMGSFSIESSELPISINNFNGSLVIQNLNVGNYDFNINYDINNTIINIPIKLNVISVFNYDNFKYELKYNETLTISPPIINDLNYNNGVFDLVVDDNQNFLIDISNGSIIINQNKNLCTNIYELTINYLSNNKNFENKIQIYVIPNINYELDNLIENTNINIKKPTINSDSKITFSIDEKNISINKNNGLITLQNFEAGNYDIIVNIKFNNNDYDLKLNFTVLPSIIFEKNIEILYASNSFIQFDYFKNNGNIIIKDKNNNDFTDSIINNISLEPGYYELFVYYTKNLIEIKKDLNIIVSPNIDYVLADKYLYKKNITIDAPTIIKHNGGKFLYKGNNLLIDENTGQIDINKPEVKNYLINYEYKYNNFSFNKSIKFTVIPIVEYIKDIKLFFGINNIIDKPLVNPSGGVFTIDKQSNNKNLKINIDGSINLNKNIIIGDYFIFVNYTLNRIITQIPINFLIKPNINYDSEFFYDKKIINTIKPLNTTHNNGLFSLKNDYNGLFKINNDGEIYIDNTINIGLYLIEIDYTVLNITSTNKINVFVCPDIFYEETNYSIIYGSEFIIKEPQIIDIGGEFISNDKNFIVDKTSGEIIISKNLLPGIYNFAIYYKVNESIKTITFNLNVYPSLNYDSIDIIYNTKSKSNSPIFNPTGGIFTCTYNKNIIIDNNTGILTFGNSIEIGSYNILVKYVYNSIFTEYNYSFNVLPNISYNDEYDFIDNKILIIPNKINPTGGKFKILDNDNFFINGSGEIKIKEYIIGTIFLDIEYEKILTVYKKIKINIAPNLFYSDITINYKDKIIIKPNILFNKGTFLLNNYNDKFIIDEYGVIKNKLDIEVNKYILDVTYCIDDIILNRNINIIVLPTIKFDDVNISVITNPNNGVLTIVENIDNISIDKNNGKIILGDNLQLGINNLTLKYVYNNIEIFKNISIKKNLFLTYEKSNTIIKGIETEFTPTTNFLNGEYSLIKNNKNITIDKNTGILKINKNIDLGEYKVEVQYSINGFSISHLVIFSVLAPFNYQISTYEFNYGEITNIEPSINSTSNEFTLSEEVSGISIDKNNGIIHIENLDVGQYIFNVSCFSCNQILCTSVKINILPILNYRESLINIKYGNTYSSKIPKIYPDNGIFYTESNIISLNSDGTFRIKPDIDVNIYYFDIIYEVKNIKTIKTIKLIVNPVFEYKSSEISFDYGTEFYSDIPTYQPKDGIFTIVNNPKGITIKNNGILHFTNELGVGSYDLSILYKINKINLTNTLNVKILPKFFYNTVDLTIYNKDFINYYKKKNISFESFNDIFQCEKIINSSKPIISNKGYFTVNNPQSIVNINGDTGIITLKNNNIGNYTFNVSYKILNINKSYLYQILIIPLFKYDNSIYKIKYGTEFNSKPPIIYPEGGMFSFAENYEFFDINVKTGEILCKNNAIISNYNIVVFYELNGYLAYNEILFTVFPDTFIQNYETILNGKNILKINNYYEGTIIQNYKITNETIEILTDNIGLYKFVLDATYKNIDFNINFDITVYSKILYENDIYYVDYGKTIIISKPKLSYISENGYFEITNKIKGITIDKLSGEIYVFDKLHVKEYNININYVFNDIQSKTNVTVIVKPIVEYNKTNYEFNYGSEITCVPPTFYPNNGIFKTNNDNITIDKNGVVTVTSQLIGLNNFTVTYNLNNINVDTDISIIIKPTILYEEKYYIKYGITNIISPTVLNPPDYDVKIKMLPQNMKLEEKTGNITILENCLPDIYPITLFYNINGVESISNFNIIVDLFFNKTTKIVYGKQEIISFHDNDFNMKYSIVSKIDKTKVYIKDNKLFINNLEIDNHTIKINYKINKIDDEFDFNICVLPEIIYDDEYVFNFGDKINILPNSYSPVSGIFKLNSDLFVIDRKGCISQKQNVVLNINKYDVNIEYSVNKIKINSNISIKIKPLLVYSQNVYEGVYNESLIINPLNYLPKKLVFSVEPYGEISDTGKIQISNLEIGKYFINVHYDITCVNLELIIKPMFFYEENNIIINFGTNKTLVPSVTQNNGKFYIKNNINGFLIDENSGIIKVINLLPDSYVVKVFYCFNDIEVSTEIKIIVNPILIYNNNNLLIKYKTDITTLVPTFNPGGGKFFTDSKILSNNIYLDETNGKIVIDEANIGNYDINIKYSYNNQIVNSNLVFSIIPVVLYDFCDYTFYNGIDNFIEKPYLNPYGGKFSLNSELSLSKYIKISSNGSIQISENINVGNYDFCVIYEYNKIQFSTKFNITINPYLYYENVIIEYQNNTFINEPFFSVQNHDIYDFSVLEYGLIINSNGKITNFNSLNVGTYKIFINYSHQNKIYQTYFICQILPIIKVGLNEKTINFYPDGGHIDFNDKYLEIKKNRILYKNIYDDIIIPITYTFNNISKKIYLQYFSKPIKVFDSNIIAIFNKDKQIPSYVSSGIISSNNKPKNLKIDDLSLNIENLEIGKYNFIIEYLVNNLSHSENITLTILPNFSYKNKYLEIMTNNGLTTEIPIMEPSNGKIFIKQNIKNINVNNNGQISSFTTFPGLYDLTINYVINDIISSDNITLCCKPTITLQNDNYIIKYGDIFTINNCKFFPLIGQINSSVGNILLPTSYNNSKTEINIDYIQQLNIGIHNINIEYIVNGIKNSIIITLCVEPTINYINKNYITKYDKNLSIDPPQLSHKNGIFNIDIKSENIINDDDIIITNDGGINMNPKLEIGNYTLYISYFIDTFIITDILTVTIDPYFYYDENIFNIIYNSVSSKCFINAPKFYPDGGIFYIDTNNQHVTIDKNNGIIELNDLNIGKYIFNVFYKFKKNTLKSNITIIMNPSINYELSVINIKYKSRYIINNPEISNDGGLFSCKNLPKGILLNSKTGGIVINQKDFVDVGFYNLIINYNINQLTTSTNIYINIIH